MMRIEAIWLAVEPVDMRAGADRLLARVVQVFGASRAHHAYVFSNARSTRIKFLVHDGFGVWCAVRRLNIGGFVWPRHIGSSSPSSSSSFCSSSSSPSFSSPSLPPTLVLTKEQFDALALGLPWQRLEEYKLITRM